MGRYTATIEVEETITNYGQGEIPDLAYKDFIDKGGVENHIDYYDLDESRRAGLKVEIYKTLWVGDAGCDDLLCKSEGWCWMLGDLVDTRTVD